MNLPAVPIAVLCLSTLAGCGASSEAPTPTELRAESVGTLRLQLDWQRHPEGEAPAALPTSLAFVDPEEPEPFVVTVVSFDEDGASVDLDLVEPGRYRLMLNTPGYLPVVSAEVYEIGEEPVLVDFTVEGTTLGEASMLCDEHCVLRAGDANQDGRIDEADLIVMDAGEAQTHVDYDLDGELSSADVAMMTGNFGFGSPDLSEIYDVTPVIQYGECLIAATGIGHAPPECLSVAFEWEIYDELLYCSEKHAKSCQGCEDGPRCGSSPRDCDECLHCVAEVSQCM